MAVPVQKTKTILRIGMALFGGLEQPMQSLAVIEGYTLAVVIHRTEDILRIYVALLLRRSAAGHPVLRNRKRLAYIGLQHFLHLRPFETEQSPHHSPALQHSRFHTSRPIYTGPKHPPVRRPRDTARRIRRNLRLPYRDLGLSWSG